MKNLILSILLIFLFLQGFAQDLAYEVRGKFTRPVTKEVLEQSNLLRDFIPGYPSNWVKDIISVEILTTENGNVQKAIGQNESLNEDQRNILRSAELENEVQVNVRYRIPNSVTEIIDNRNMVVNMTVVPEIQAEYLGGYEKLKQYLKEKLIVGVAEHTPEEFQKGKVTFIIDPTGKPVNIEISASSGDTETDNLLLEIFNHMPDWKPAQNAKGEKVKQQFEFSMGIGGC